VRDVAEHAIALIFACARKIYSSRHILEKSTKKDSGIFRVFFPHYESTGRHLVFRSWRIGSRVYRKLEHFGFRIIGYDPYLSEKRQRRDEEYEMGDKETLFRQSDFITIHTPLSDDTRRIVNEYTLSLMKPTAYIINTAPWASGRCDCTGKGSERKTHRWRGYRRF